MHVASSPCATSCMPTRSPCAIHRRTPCARACRGMASYLDLEMAVARCKPLFDYKPCGVPWIDEMSQLLQDLGLQDLCEAVLPQPLSEQIAALELELCAMIVQQQEMAMAIRKVNLQLDMLLLRFAA
jgi:hypothetical protein